MVGRSFGAASPKPANWFGRRRVFGPGLFSTGSTISNTSVLASDAKEAVRR